VIRDTGGTARRGLAAMQRHAASVPAAMVRVYALRAFEGLVTKTPVDTGLARASWQVAEGTPAGAGMGMTVAALSGTEVVYLTNALPYIPVLEYGGYPQRPGGTLKVTPEGFSRQAPQGMIGVTVEELRALAAELGAQIRLRLQAGSFPAGA